MHCQNCGSNEFNKIIENHTSEFGLNIPVQIYECKECHTKHYICPDCDGKGFIEDEFDDCENCHGMGVVSL